MEVKVKLDLRKLAEKYSGRRITVRQLADELGMSAKSAGRLLATMERHGLARKISRRVYEIEYKEV